MSKYTLRKLSGKQESAHDMSTAKIAVKPVTIKTAVITGAVSGIGLALTQHLLIQAGDSNTNVHWRVVLADINEAAYDEIKTTLNDGHHIFVAN
jgi:NADP-dependent 3-hydroxy acid dehydrogenase YdfG